MSEWVSERVCELSEGGRKGWYQKTNDFATVFALKIRHHTLVDWNSTYNVWICQNYNTITYRGDFNQQKHFILQMIDRAGTKLLHDLPRWTTTVMMVMIDEIGMESHISREVQRMFFLNNILSVWCWWSRHSKHKKTHSLLKDTPTRKSAMEINNA